MIEDWRSKWGAASDPWLSVGLSDGDAGGVNRYIEYMTLSLRKETLVSEKGDAR